MALSSHFSCAVSEADRLHALAASEVLGVVGIEALDELVALAARLVGTPVAAVNLIGEHRQWTVAGVGLPIGDAARDTSLCDFAIAQDDATVIEDLWEDARFAGHPKVAEGLRFYAGFPLLSAEGLAIGAFCVADVRPRALNDDQLLSLRAVARAAAAQIDALRHVAAARDAGERLQAVIDHAPDAFVSMDSDGRITEWNLEAWLMFGWTREEACGRTVSELIIPPELRDAHGRGLTRYLSTRQSGMLNRPMETTALTKSAHILAVELTVAATGGRTAVCFNAFIRDISERKAAEAVLRASERRLAEAQHIGGVGSFEWDAESDVVSWSDELCRIAGVVPGEQPTDLAGFLALVEEEDRARIAETVASSGDDAFSENDYRLVRPNGDVRWVHGRRRSFISEDGSARLAGTLQDITEQRAGEYALRDAEERFRRSFDESAIGMALVSLKGRWMQVNDALCNITGYPAEQLVGLSFQDITHPHDVHADTASIHQMMDGDRVRYHTEKRYIHSDGHIIWIQLNASLARDAAGEPLYFISQIQDITERKLTEQALAEKHRQLAEAQSAAQLGSWRYELGGEEDGRCSWSEEMWRIVGREPQPTAPAPATCLQWVHGGDRERVAAAVLAAIASSRPLREEIRVLRPDGVTTHVDLRLEVFAGSSGGRLVRGTAQDVSGERAVLEQLRAATEHAEQIAAALEDEVKTAAAVQQGLLPRTPPVVVGARLGGLCVPAAQVGGDYYDFIVSPSGGVFVVIADVAGHSISSALLMAMARAVLREHVGRGLAPHEVLEGTNATMYADLVNAELFITMFCARYDPQTGMLDYANGGQNRPLLRRADASVEELDADGAPAGVLRHVGFESRSTQLGAGDLLVLYTDGVVESGVEAGDPFGDARLRQIVARSGQVAPEDLGALIHAGVVAHAGAAAARCDDITVAALRVDGAAGGAARPGG